MQSFQNTSRDQSNVSMTLTAVLYLTLYAQNYMLVFFSLYYPVFNGYMRRRGTKLQRQNQSPYSPSKKSLYFLLWKTSYNKTLIERYQIQKQYFFLHFCKFFYGNIAMEYQFMSSFLPKLMLLNIIKPQTLKGNVRNFLKKLLIYFLCNNIW